MTPVGWIAVCAIGALATCLAQAQPKTARHDFPYESRYVTVNGSKMHYIEAGIGDPIVFIHGNPTWSYLWRKIIPHVQGHGRVVAVDLIGFGKSEKPNLIYRVEDHARYLKGFIDALALEKLTLVVHDWGSFLGFQYAMNHQENVRAIAFMEAILPGSGGPSPVPGEWQERMREFGGLLAAAGPSDSGQEIVLRQNAFIERLLPLGIVRTLSPDEWNAYREPFIDPASRQPILMLRQEVGNPSNQAVSIAYAKWLARTLLPKLMIRFTPGAIGSDRQVAWVRANLPNVAIVDGGVGIHWVQEDAPELIGRAIASWMDDHQRAADRTGRKDESK